MSVQGFTDIIQGPLAQYLQFSKQIGGDVAQHGDLVQRAFSTQLQFLTLASQSGKPTNQNDIINFLKPTSDGIVAIQEFRERNRTSQFFNHLSAISESIAALGWVAVVSNYQNLFLVPDIYLYYLLEPCSCSLYQRNERCWSILYE